MATRKKKQSAIRDRCELTRPELLELVIQVEQEVSKLLRRHPKLPEPCEPLRCGLANIKRTLRSAVHNG